MLAADLQPEEAFEERLRLRRQLEDLLRPPALEVVDMERRWDLKAPELVPEKLVELTGYLSDPNSSRSAG